MIGRELWVSHIWLYKFYESACSSDMFEEIFHVFIHRRIALYVGDKKHIEKDYLDNSEEVWELTKKEFESML